LINRNEKAVNINDINGLFISNGGEGITHTETGETVSPLDLVSDELIELSDWELQDFAIQIVTDHLEKEGCQIIFTLWYP